MTRPSDFVEVVCARCGTVYTTCLRPTVDCELDPWSEESGSPATAACPECGAELSHDDTLEPLVVGPHPAHAEPRRDH